jgi:hypothetical protein
VSPAVKKLRAELESVKDRFAKHQGEFAVCGPNGPVGLDVIESLFTVIVAQDEEIERLKSALIKAGIIPGTVVKIAPNQSQPPKAPPK